MFDFDKLSASKFYTAPPAQRVVEFSPPGIDVDNILKVLSLAVDARCVSVDAMDGFAQVSGRTNFRLTYLDKEGVARGVDYNADFSIKAEGDFSAADSVSATIKVVETDVEVAGALKLSAVLEVEACAVRREEFEALVRADDCYKTEKEMYIPSFIAAKTTSAPFEEEQEVGGEVSSVLGLNTVCVVKKAVATDGGVNASIGVFATVTYVEGGEIKQRDFAVELEEELNVDGAEASDTVDIQASVKNAKIVLQGVTDDNVIKIEGEVALKVQVFRCAKVGVIEDLFTLRNEVEITRATAPYVCFDGCGYFSKRIEGVAMLGDNRAAALDINALPYARCYTSKAYVDDGGKLVVEGVVNTDIIYSDENGYNSVRTEIPFSLEKESEKPFSQIVKVKCGVEKISASVKRERELELDIRLGIEACGFSPVTLSYISAVEVGEEKPQNTSGVSLYIAKGEDTLLDLCKALTAMPEDILAQNPALTFPLEAGVRVVYFRAAS